LNPDNKRRQEVGRIILSALIALVGCAAGVGLLMGIDRLLELLGLVNLSLLVPIARMAIYSFVAVAFGFLFYFLSPAIIRLFSKAIRSAETALNDMPFMDLVGGTIGLILGLVIALLLSSLYASIPVPVVNVALTVLTYPILAYLGWTIGKKRRSEFRMPEGIRRERKGDRTPKGDKANAAKPKVLDTSVIIDGRIFDICKTGIVEGTLVIPSFVLQELRHVADSADSLKRNRGRRGLDILNKIQKELDVSVRVEERDYEDVAEVDAKLLRLATELNGAVVTNDYNLNKVAAVQGVQVLNINELANAVKPVVLPGEEMVVTILKDGKEAGQGVAYLDDGTMIVVDGGRRYMNETVEVIVTSVLQTAAGRMIFARLK
jgi:uncharacterized protein YacL